jgi:hypothetical protein
MDALFLTTQNLSVLSLLAPMVPRLPPAPHPGLRVEPRDACVQGLAPQPAPRLLAVARQGTDVATSRRRRVTNELGAR